MDTLLTVTILLSLITYISGLKCIECLHLDIGQSNGSDSIYHVLDGYRNPQCISDNPKQQAKETICSVVVQQPNTVQKCGYMYGEVKSYITSVNRAVKFTFYERNCFQVPKTMENRCYARRRLTEDQNYLYNRLNHLYLGFRVDSFDGNLCLCSNDLCVAVAGACQAKYSLVSLIICVFLCCCFMKNIFG